MPLAHSYRIAASTLPLALRRYAVCAASSLVEEAAAPRCMSCPPHRHGYRNGAAFHQQNILGTAAPFTHDHQAGRRLTGMAAKAGWTARPAAGAIASEPVAPCRRTTGFGAQLPSQP